MAKKIRIVLTLQLNAGKATPAPPVGTALGPHGINIVEFTKTYNEKTADKVGQVIPAQITIFEDRSFTFVLKTPPAAGPAPQGRRHRQGRVDGRPRKRRAGSPRDQVRDIAETEAARPQRQRHRGRDEDHRGHRPQHGHRGRRLAVDRTAGRSAGRGPHETGEAGTPAAQSEEHGHGAARQEVPGRGEARRPHQGLHAGRGGQARQGHLDRQLRSVRRGPSPPRGRPPPCRPDGPRHGRPAPRHGQGRQGSRVRPGREGPGGPARRAPTRWAARTS